MKVSDLKKGDVIKYELMFSKDASSGIAVVKKVTNENKIFLKELINFTDKHLVGAVWFVYSNDNNIFIEEYYGNVNPANILPDEFKFLLGEDTL